MTWSDLYSELRTWQTSIASIFGFSGLIIGALWNFHLNRRRDSRIRNEEMLSVAAALYGEITLLRTEVARVANNVADKFWKDKEHYEASPFKDEDFLRSIRMSSTVIFDALASKLGVLPFDVVIGVSRFYQKFREVEFYLPLLVQRPQDKMTYSILYVLEPARDAVDDVEITLKSIESMLRVKGERKVLMLKNVEEVIEFERSSFED